MRLRKGTVFILMLFLVVTITSLFGKVQANQGNLVLNLKMLRNSGYGYKLGNTNKNIWKLYEVGGNADDTIYCLKGGPGFGSADIATAGAPVATTYTRYFDLKDPDNIPETYKTALPDVNGDNYKALLWILDNCYIPAKINASTQAKQEAEEYKNDLLNRVKEYALEEGDPNINSNFDFSCLTEDDIDAVQQLAVWHYTNEEGDPYHVESYFEFYINSISGTDANYDALSTFEGGVDRANASQALFNYLVETPKKPDFEYQPITSEDNTNPVQFLKTLQATIEIVDNRKIVGPYQLEQLKNIEYSLSLNVTDKNGNKVTDVIILDNNKQPIEDTTTLKDLIGQQFYISIPENTDTSSIKLQIDGNYYKTITTYWSVENPTANDQPVVILKREKKTYTDEILNNYSTPEFDLSLRKFITTINGIAPTNTRVPNVNLDTLINGTFNRNGNLEHTATYTHPKNALTVKTGDKVVYTIRIYNEGEVDGTATEITDYLPSGLEFIPASESTINQTYGWSNPSGDKKTIVTNYLSNELITAFDGENLNYKDVQIECKVVAEAGEADLDLKNIAEITAHKDKDGNTTVVDRDSVPDDVIINNYGTTSQEDDDDFEILIINKEEKKYFDLSLRKFITSVSNDKGTKNYNRIPVVDVTPLVNGETTAIYNHDKTPVNVTNGDIVTYTIRVYNEGQLDGYVTEITDYLPPQLEFIVNDELNAKYGWTVSNDGRTVTTNITSPKTENSANRDDIYNSRTNETDKVLLKAFNGTTLDYIDVQIKCKVKQNIDLYEKITNIAEITGFTDNLGNNITDRDSKEDNVVLPTDESLPTYKDTEIERGDTYIPGQEDDDDFEKLVLQIFDLSLRKFITGVNETEITSRAPVFNKTEDNEYEYIHPKDPVDVANGNTVIYTLRIFNEGNVAGYASEVKDDLPEGLEFLPEHPVNTAFKWKMYKEDGTETTDVKEASYIKTQYLSKDNESIEGNNLIDAFDPETMTMPDYKDLKIAFKVTEPNTSDRIIINTAEITDDADKNGDPIDDVDSVPDNNDPDEDDIDIEKIKVKYFDLSLKKWVTASIVTYDGKTTVTETGHTGDENPEPPAKVEIRGSRISKTTVKFRFNIKVTNEGEIAGYVKELIDYVPEGLKFVAEDNPMWREEDGKILTDQLKDVLIEPGQSETVEIVLTWINNQNNMGLKTNWAEIYEDDNDYDSPDIDSTPGNNVKGEDDIDDAPVMLSVVTGSAPTYITLAMASIAIFASGVILIKKFVI